MHLLLLPTSAWVAKRGFGLSFGMLGVELCQLRFLKNCDSDSSAVYGNLSGISAVVIKENKRSVQFSTEQTVRSLLSLPVRFEKE